MAEQTIPENAISEKVIGAAIEVHRALGPGLLESVYEECLAHEMSLRKIPFERQKQISLKYKDLSIPAGFRVDFLLGGLVVVELKSVENLLPIHEAQLLSYLRLTGCRLGLLINFNVEQLVKGGIRRRVNGL
ncbi:MAG: GxxExxY protein [Anaerolineaceae bacterium]|nr:GxxExxY protein [Anaerolineaceae bacterium]